MAQLRPNLLTLGKEPESERNYAHYGAIAPKSTNSRARAREWAQLRPLLEQLRQTPPI
ncbi:uncharacterized protein G2W53_017661 [Senna tora]|uniref:Uncharacterized protein n=1 Tax=Senna tora TaxID=362788 RepID=A0A834TSC1_9FABA|nr:uncharacterized protein G2W53_017661 [Senna tora]